MNDYIVATIKPWNIAAFHRYSKSLSGNWHLAESPSDLNDLLSSIQPKYIFFPHWSWIVEQAIINKYNCVCFHMTDVPYGRGGSPLQNLIARGHKSTKLTALKMISEIDAGPVYCKMDLSLVGRAQQIYEDMSHKVYDVISYIVEDEPVPEEQVGEIVTFQRRIPEQSQLPIKVTLEKIYDHIRMLDADTYPKAFIVHDDYRIEFMEAEIKNNEILSKVKIKKEEK